jgi:hypothetical protein
MMTRARWLGLLMFCTHCSWCAAPKPTPEDDPHDRDAAPHSEEVRSRCSVQSKVALPGTLDLGRVAVTPSRVMIGARRGARAGVLDTDGLTVRFTEVADSVGDAPPPVPLASGERTLSVEYEGAAKTRHLVVRDVASPDKPLAELPRDPDDESLAYDAVMLVDGTIAIAWDAPAEEGSAIYASMVHGNTVGEAVRLSPKDVDADVPRLAAMGPTLVATWIAHRALPKSDAAAAPEGAGQDLDHAWVEMLAFDSSLHATMPLRHLTPDTGRIVTFDVMAETAPPAVTVVARDALELHPGQGGTVVLVRVHGLEVDAPLVLAEHVGRGVPLYSTSTLLYVDPSDHGHAVVAGSTSPEPVLDSARPLGFLPGRPDILVIPEAATELRVVRCL